MNSFDRLLEIYPSAYTDAERAQTFLWYHLRKYPKKKTASLKTIQTYFRKADRQVPSIEEIRSAFISDAGYSKRFPPGEKPNTFGFGLEFMEWHDRNFALCFESSGFIERVDISIAKVHAEHPFWFWLSALGSVASIIGIPLAVILWVIS